MVFDGNGFKFVFTNGTDNCDLNDSLFDVVYESTVKNVIIDYNLRGDMASAVAKYVSRSNLSNISFNGTIRLAKAVSGEAFASVNQVKNYLGTQFGALTAFANYSSYEKITFAGAITTENNGKAAQIAPVIGDSTAIAVKDANVTLDELNCGSSICSGAFILSDRAKAQISSLSLNANLISGSDVVVSIAQFLPNLYASQVHIAKLESTGESKTASAFAYGPSGIAVNEIYDVSVKIDEAHSKGDISGLAHTAKANVAKYNLDIASAESVTGISLIDEFGDDTAGNSLKNSEIKVTAYSSEEGTFIALMKNAKNAIISDVKVTLGEIKAKLIYTANNAFTGSSVTNLNIEADKLEASADFCALANTMTKSSIVDSQYHAADVKAANAAVITKSSESAIEYTGISMDSVTADAAKLFGNSSKDTWSNIAVYALTKVKTAGNDLFVTLADPKIQDVVSMVQQSKLAECSEDTYEAVLEHTIGTLTAETAANVWWYQRAEEETATAHAGETPTASAFDKAKVADVMATLKNWNKRSFSENGTNVELPWPDKKPEVVPEPEPEQP